MDDKIRRQLKEWLEDLESGRIDEMDIPDLDLCETDREKVAFKEGMKLAIESALQI